MFKAIVFVIYCDPEKDPAAYRKVLNAMCEARKSLPLELKTDKDGDIIIDKEKDIIFILSSSPNLMFYQFNTEKCEGPQALLMPFGDTFNTMKTHLKNLKTFDDLSIEDWIKKAENSEEEFAPQPGDS